MNVKFITLRLNIEKEQHRRGLQILQKRRETKGGSYTDVILQALLRDEDSGRVKNPDVEIIVRNCAERITAATDEMLRITLPSFFAGMTANGGFSPGTEVAIPPPPAQESETEAPSDTIPDEEIPWDYLGE